MIIKIPFFFPTKIYAFLLYKLTVIMHDREWAWVISFCKRVILKQSNFLVFGGQPKNDLFTRNLVKWTEPNFFWIHQLNPGVFFHRFILQKPAIMFIGLAGIHHIPCSLILRVILQYPKLSLSYHIHHINAFFLSVVTWEPLLCC